MREVGANPFGIKNDYMLRDKKPNYYYTLEKTNNPGTLNKVIDSIERNFDSILGINSNADIYTLGAYIPKSLESVEMNIFRDLIIDYNEKLQILCNKYNITFINTEEIGKTYNRSKANFHITTAGHNALAEYILDCMYQNKFGLCNSNERVVDKVTDITDDGAAGIIKATLIDYDASYDRAMQLSNYVRERELRIADEHRRETEIFQKVLVHRNK